MLALSLAQQTNLIPLPKLGQPPPKELRLFKFGPNPTTKGVLTLTQEGAQAAIDLYTREGRALTFDFEHATFDPTTRPEDRKAAGTFRLELRADGLWAVDCQWTTKVAQGITDGEWNFFSPAVLRTKAGLIAGIRNIALTNLPATYGAQPLLLSMKGGSMDPKMMTKCLKDMIGGAEMMLSSAQACAGMEDTRLKTLGESAVGMLPDLITQIQALIEELDPAGEVPSEMSQLSALRDLAKELTGKETIESMKGSLRALASKPRALEQALTAQKKGEVERLVTLGVAQLRKIPAADQDSYLTHSPEELMTFLSEAQELIPEAATKPLRPPLAPPANPQDAQAEADAIEVLSAARGKRGGAAAPGGAGVSVEDVDAAEILRAGRQNAASA